MAGYSHTEAFDSGHLAVGDIHNIHYKQYGKSDGKPVLFLHGGPGGGTSIKNTAFFDPAVYCVILLDQRGCGKSTPTCEIRQNTTSDLITDIEALRKHLEIEKWFMVFGGSWGSTLALLYAQDWPNRVSSLVLRGIFLCRKSELSWGDPYRESGAAQMFPEAAEELLAHFTKEERGDWVKAAYEQLQSEDRDVRVKMARAVNTWDFKRATMKFDPESLSLLDNEEWSLHHALLLTHYVINDAFIRQGQILEEYGMSKIRQIPCTIVQGRYDVVCPPQAAWDLHKAWPSSNLVVVPDAGHSASEPGTFAELIKACDELRERSL